MEGKGSNGGEAGKKAFKFVVDRLDPALIAAGGSVSRVAAPDGQTLSLLFSELGVRLAPSATGQPGSGGESAVRVLSFRVPVEVPPGQGVSSFSSDVRFWINKAADSHVLVVVSVAGVTRIWDYPFGDAADNEQVTETIYSWPAKPEGEVFLGGFSYAVTVLITAQASSKDGEAEVQFESIDVRGCAASPPAELETTAAS